MENVKSNSAEPKIEMNELLQSMTLEEKIQLLSGDDFWHTKSVKGIPSIMMTDGPHGLRKQQASNDHLGLARSVPATCFPTASTTACSFDTELMEEIGDAIATECKANGVSVILGPGLNIKRNPLCGRNFEYFSEDPLVSGNMAAGMVNGIQSKKVGAVIKHFAANNQEQCRMVSNSIVDERALHEIYLSGFEHVVKQVHPAGVMGAYNLLNGTYCCENQQLLSDILRNDWGFDGFVVTDWGAINDRVAAIKAGCDLEMPTDSGFHTDQIKKAIQTGQLQEEDINKCVRRLIELADRYALEESDKKIAPEFTKHHSLARKAARESAVLLKNNGLLPFHKDKKLLVIGEFAKEARYQGAGSSQINPIKMNQICDELDVNQIDYSYAKGYDANSGQTTKEMIQEAVTKAEKAEQVLIVIGLPAIYESEGFDRKNMKLPCGHNELVDAVAKTNANVCVLLMTGGAVLLPWRNQVSAILNLHLSGQNAGGAAYDLLFGDYSPCGKLAESYPISEYDVPSSQWFGISGKTITYCESVYVGYRYFDTVNKQVAYPFGYGLSYTSFEYGNLQLSKQRLKEGEQVTVTFELTNTGDMAGKEIVELYVAPPESDVYKPVHELRAFTKVVLEAHETKTVSIQLDSRAFSYWNRINHSWTMENGFYCIEIAASSRDIRLRNAIQVYNENPQIGPDDHKLVPDYYLTDKSTLHLYVYQFEKLIGAEIPTETPDKKFTCNSTLKEIKSCRIGRKINQKIYQQCGEAFSIEESKKDNFMRMIDAMLEDLPLRALGLMSGGMMTPKQVDGIVDLLNGHYIKGLKKMKDQ